MAGEKDAVEVKNVRRKSRGPLEPKQHVTEKALKWYERNVVDKVVREAARAPRKSEVKQYKARLARVEKHASEQSRYNQVLRSAALRLAARVHSPKNGFKEASLPRLRAK